MDNNVFVLMDRIKNGEKVYLKPSEQDTLTKLADIDFLKEHIDLIDVGYVFKNKKLSEKDLYFFVRYIKKTIDFTWIAMNQTLSETFMKEYRQQLPWFHVLMNQKMSLKFIEENLAFATGNDYLPYYQREVTAEFLKKNRILSISWKVISAKFVLDEAFIIEFFEFLDKDLLLKNPQIELTDKVKLLLELN